MLEKKTEEESFSCLLWRSTLYALISPAFRWNLNPMILKNEKRYTWQKERYRSLNRKAPIRGILKNETVSWFGVQKQTWLLKCRIETFLLSFSRRQLLLMILAFVWWSCNRHLLWIVLCISKKTVKYSFLV